MVCGGDAYEKDAYVLMYEDVTLLHVSTSLEGSAFSATRGSLKPLAKSKTIAYFDCKADEAHVQDFGRAAGYDDSHDSITVQRQLEFLTASTNSSRSMQLLHAVHNALLYAHRTLLG